MAATDADQIHRELLALYSASVSEIAGFKSQQIALTNYTVILLASMVAAYRLLGETRWLEVFLVGIPVMAGWGMIIVRQLAAAIKVRRSRLSSIRAKLSSSFRDSWAEDKGPDDLGYVLLVIIGCTGLIAMAIIAGFHPPGR